MTKKNIKEVIQSWVTHDLENSASNDVVERLTEKILAQFDFNKTTVPQAALITKNVVNSFKKEEC